MATTLNSGFYPLATLRVDHRLAPKEERPKQRLGAWLLCPVDELDAPTGSATRVFRPQRRMGTQLLENPHHRPGGPEGPRYGTNKTRHHDCR